MGKAPYFLTNMGQTAGLSGGMQKRRIIEMQSDNIDMITSGFTYKELETMWGSWSPERLKRFHTLMEPVLPWAASLAKKSWKYEVLTKKLTLLQSLAEEAEG